MTAAIIGWAHSAFGRLPHEDVESLALKVAAEALEDACLAPSDIDELYMGTFNAGFSVQDFPASLLLQLDPAFRFKPATRVENACATGSAAIFQGLNAIRAGRARRVLVVGVEKMTDAPSPEVGRILMRASYVREEGSAEGGFAGVFGRIARAYFERHGDQSDPLARIASKNHMNGALNPLAHIRRPLDFEFCRTTSLNNPVIAGPLRRTDCSPVSDGAAALVLSDIDTAKAAQKAIVFRAAEQVNDYLPLSKRDILAFEGPKLAWAKALESAGLSLPDISCAEVHDCFTIAELLMYEAMGLAAPGEGRRVIDDGISTKQGSFPVNASGGLKSKGHPIGATGVSMHVLQCAQLMGAAGDLQLPKVTVAGILNMGGAAVANYASLLERLR
jgi:acetyl-CoA C-acetyltransferase